MSSFRKKAWMLALLGGATLLQAPACTDVAIWLASASSVVTAGGVLYLVRRVID